MDLTNHRTALAAGGPPEPLNHARRPASEMDEPEAEGSSPTKTVAKLVHQTITGGDSDADEDTAGEKENKLQQILNHDQMAERQSLDDHHDNDTGEEKQQQQQHICCQCKRSLAKSKHLVSISGQNNQWWHSECFKCNICQIALDKETSCHLYRGQILCRPDYLKLQRDFITKCSRCHWPIGASDWVRRASQYVYHLACFSCDICLRQLSTGEQFTLKVQKKNVVRLLCRLHFAVEVSAAAVSGSGRNQNSSNRNSSSPAGKSLPQTAGGGGSCDYDDDNKRADAVSLEPMATRAANNLATTLDRTGDQYLHLLASPSRASLRPPQRQLDQQRPSFLSNQGESLIQGEKPLELPMLGCGDGGIGDASSLKFNASDRIFQQAEQRLDLELTLSLNHQQPMQMQQIGDKQQHTASSISSSGSSTLGGSGVGADGSGHCGSNLVSLASKSKRVRTTFTEEQLSILQNYFQVDSNPDGQDLERIAVITGLTKRVTQVWFQNSRARQKKHMTKRKPAIGQQQQQLSGSGSNPSASCLGAGLLASVDQQQQQQQHHYVINHHQQQQHQGIGDPTGGCFDKMQDPIAEVPPHKWTIDMTAAGNETASCASSLLSSQDGMNATNELLLLDEAANESNESSSSSSSFSSSTLDGRCGNADQPVAKGKKRHD